MRLYKNFALRTLLLALSFFLNFKSYGKDYRDYHLSVIKIEESIFVKGKIDEGLDGYLQLFKDYDFVFLQDCVSAVQIALYAKNESAFLKFVDKAMKNGLMPRHLEKMSYVKKNALYQKHTDTIVKIFSRNRSSYLKTN